MRSKILTNQGIVRSNLDIIISQHFPTHVFTVDEALQLMAEAQLEVLKEIQVKKLAKRNIGVSVSTMEKIIADLITSVQKRLKANH